MNKLNLNIKYRYYDERFGDREELHPMSYLNSFNPNTILKAIEDILHYVYVRGKRKEKYWSSYNGKYMGKQYFTTINLYRHQLDSMGDRWLLELFTYTDFSDWKEGIYSKAKINKGYIFWNLHQLLDKVFRICSEWDDEVFKESLVKCLKPHFNRHNIKSFDEFNEKILKCNDEIDRWEREYRKVKFERDKEVNKIFESVGKEWVEE